MNGQCLVSALLLALTIPHSLCLESNGYYTKRFAVQVKGGNERATSVAEIYGMKNLGLIATTKDFYLFEMDDGGKIFAGDNGEWIAMKKALKEDDSVTCVEAEFKRPVENYFYTEPTDPLWDDQWFILNTGQLGVQFAQNDVNAERVWIQGVTGCNITIAVVDTGVEYTHPDLFLNFNSDVSLDICDNDFDPFPESRSERHGTIVAGEIISGKSNPFCGTGVAYNAVFGSIRLTACPISDIDIADALTYRNDVVDIYSNSWGPRDNGSTVNGPGLMLQMVVQNAVEQGRGGKGSVIVFATGNGREVDDDCSANGFCTSINTIAVGSAAVSGAQAVYDESCSCKMAVNFVSGEGSSTLLSVATTAVGGCIATFDGTSASCPVASAVIALALEVNPDLTWRDVQYLIAYTSSHERLIGGSRTINGGGLVVSHEFGFGAMDAEAIVSRARNWITVPFQQSSLISPVPNNGTAIAFNPLVINFTHSGNIVFLEHVVVRMTVGVSTGVRGDLRIELMSPFGTLSTLVDYRDKDTVIGEYTDWPFMSVHFWGEDPFGQWTLTIRSRSSCSPVDMSGLVVTLYGTDEIPEAITNIPEQCDSVCAGGCAGTGPEFCDACADLRDAHTRECITECPEGYEQRNGYCYDPALQEPVCRKPAIGSCAAVGFTACCEAQECQGSSQFCFCDELCHGVGDCCNDIDDICPPPDISYIPFITLGTTPGVDTQTLPVFDEGASNPIVVPGGFPIGVQRLTTAFVITNGYFALGAGFIDPSPELFPVVRRYLVAPFWSDVVGRIQYEVHSNKSASTALQDISTFISSEEGIVFEAEWMLIAEWNEVFQYRQPTSLTNTYQGVLVTDGVESYALYTYRCGEMEWSGGATIGFGASDELYANLRISGSAEAVTVACLNSPTTQWSNILYKLTLDIVTVRFAQEMYTVSEAVGSQNLALYVCVTASTVERSFSVTLQLTSGTAVANVDWTERAIQLEFQPGRSAEECGSIGIVDDTIPEDTERFMIELSSSDYGIVIAEPGQVVVEIEDDDESGEDTRLIFINDTPKVIGNSVTAEFVVGESFKSVLCDATTQQQKDCSGGSVTFDGLNPDRGLAYTLAIRGTLSDGTIVFLNREFHVGTIVACWTHLINDGITVNEDSVTIEWQGTGPGANVNPPLPFQCRLDGVTVFQQCTSPHSIPIEGLSSGEYVISIRNFDPNRLVCTNRNLARFDFQITN